MVRNVALYLILAAGTLFALPCAAQRGPTQYKTSDISVFGAFASNSTGFSNAPNAGLTAGMAFTRYLPTIVSPALEARATLTDGPDVRERAYIFGPRAQVLLAKRFRPYGDFMIGKGFIHFNHPGRGAELGDNAFVKSFGGGVDVDMYRTFELKADWQSEFWTVGLHDVRHPSVLTVGLTYRIPFRPWNSRVR